MLSFVSGVVGQLSLLNSEIFTDDVRRVWFICPWVDWLFVLCPIRY